MGRFPKAALSIGTLAVGLAMAIAFRAYFGPSVMFNLLGMSFVC